MIILDFVFLQNVNISTTNQIIINRNSIKILNHTIQTIPTIINRDSVAISNQSNTILVIKRRWINIMATNNNIFNHAITRLKTVQTFVNNICQLPLTSVIVIYPNTTALNYSFRKDAAWSVVTVYYIHVINLYLTL